MKHGGLINNVPQATWESLLTTADNDFVSVLILWYAGIAPGSTYAWMLPHTVEKYLKAYLLKLEVIKSSDLKHFGKDGHALIEIWNKYKTIATTTTSKPKLNNAFDELINDLSTIKPGLRYSGFVEYSSDTLLYFYIVLCSLLRYLNVGKQKYRSTFYGLNDVHFLLMNYHPMSLGYGRIIVKKMLHLSLEHGCAFTNMGSVNSMGLDEYSITNIAIFEKLPDCPICNESSNIDQPTMVKFYRAVYPVNIDQKEQ
jgi:hypothetical protein